MSEPVQVFIRVKPEHFGSHSSSIDDHDDHFNDTRHSVLVPIDGQSIRISPPDGSATIMSRRSVPAVDDRIFSYDQILDENCTQEDVYDLVSHQVRATVQGYNATIFALGCTGSGKTHTMTGTSSAPGIIPRAISEIFSIIETTAAHEKDVFFYVRLSFVELYNNNFRNLLEFASKDMVKEHSAHSPSLIHPLVGASGTTIHRSDKIEVRESQSAGVFLAGHNLRIPVTTAQEAFRLIARGNKSRATGSTQCNDVSSRSHAILTLHVESRVGPSPSAPLSPVKTSLKSPTKGSAPVAAKSSRGGAGAELRLGKIHLVDLAGSERISMSGVEGDTLVETQNINLSLTALGDVLAALSKNASVAANHTAVNSSGMSSPGKHTMVPVPYRNSKLTHLLKDSLGGNSKTIMLTTVQSSPEYYHQTLVSLKYASRAKKVRNRSLVNRDIIGDSGIHAVSKEIERLKNRLDARSNEFDGLKNVQLRDAKENIELKRRLQEMSQATISEKDELEAQLSHVIHSQAGELVTQKKKISHLQFALQEELSISQNKIAEQEKEIIWLKKALDETSSAALQPIEQLERVQRVADAWQTQAKHSQSELETTSRQVEELRVTNRTYSSNMNDLAAEKKRLQLDLQQGQRRMDEYEEVMTSAKRERDSATNQAEQLREQSTLSSQTIVQLKKQLSESTNRITALERALEHAQTELKLSADTAARVETDHKHDMASMTEANQQLKDGLQETLGEIDRQMQRVGDEASSQLEAMEAKVRQEQENTRRAEAEVEAMKRRIVEIHGDVEQVTNQREETITRLKESLEKSEGDLQNNQLQQQQMDKVIKGQIKELNALRNSQEDTAVEFSNKCLEFENELARQRQHIAQLKERHVKDQEDLKQKHEQQLHELHENSTLEIVKFRDDISTSLTAQQKVWSDKHDAEVTKAKDEERVQIENQWMAKLVALEEALRFKEEELRLAALQEKEEEVAQVKEEWGAVLSEQLDAREVQHAVSVKKLTQELVAAKEVELQRLMDHHADEVAELTTKHQLQLTCMQEELSVLFEKNQDEKVHAMEAQHDQHIQELRAGQFTVLKETENAYKIEIEKLQTTITHYEEAHVQNTIEVQTSHVTELEKMKQQHQHELEEAFETYQNELDKMRKNLVATKMEEKLTLSKTHEENTTTLTKKLETKYDKQLQFQLQQAEECYQTMLQQQLTETHNKVEAEWRNRLVNAEEENQGDLEAALSMQREELQLQHQTEAEAMLEKAHAHFQEVKHTEEVTRQTDHQQGLELLTAIHATEKKELGQRHEDAVAQLRLSMEESFGKEMDQLKEIHAIELKGRLKEKNDQNEQQLAAELSSLRQRMEALNADQERSSQQLVTEQRASLTEELLRKHEEDLSNQGELLDRAHDRNLQLAVQEVRQLLENLHHNETHSLQEQHRLQTEQLQTQFDEVLANHVAEVRTTCEEDKQSCLERELSAVREEHKEAQTNLHTQHLAALQAVEKAGAERFSAHWEEMKAVWEKEHSQLLERSLETQRLDLSAEHLDALQGVHSQSHGLLEQARAALQDAHEEELTAQEQRLRQEAAQVLETEKTAFQQATASLQQTHRQEMEEHSENMKFEYTERIEALKSELSAQHTNDLQGVEAQSALKSNELRVLLEETMSVGLEEQRQELLGQHESALSALEERLGSNHNTSLEGMQQQLDTKEATLQDMILSVESLKVAQQQDHDQLLSAHAREKLEMAHSHEAKVELLRDDYNKFFEESKRNSELAAESATRNLLHDQQIELLEAQNVKISAVKDELSAEYAQQVASLQAEHVIQLEKVARNTEMESQSRYNTRIDEFKSQWQLERENAEASLRAQYKDEISLLRVEYNRFLDESKQNVTLASEMAMKNSLQAQKAELLETHREQSAQSLDALRESLLQAHTTKLAALEKTHEQVVIRLREEQQAGAEEAQRLYEVSMGLQIEHALHLQKLELEETHKQVLLKLVADLNQESDVQKLEAKQALEDLQLGFKTTLEEGQVEAKKEREQQVTAAVRENQSKLEEEHSRQLQAAKEGYAEEIALLRREYNMFLEENKKNSEVASQMALESALETQHNELDAAHLAALDVLRSTLVTQHATELSGVLEEHEAYLDQQANRAEEEYQTRLSDQLSSLKGHMQEEIERAEEDTRREFASKLEQDFQQVQQQTLDQAEKDLAARVLVETHKLTRDHELALSAQYEDVRREADERLLATQKQAEEWKQKYESRKQFFDNEKALTDARSVEARQALEESHARDLAELQASSALDREGMLINHETELEELRTQLHAKHEQNLSDKMAGLNTFHDQTELLQEKDSKISELRQGLEDVEKHHGDLLAAALQEREGVLTQQQEVSQQALRRTHDVELEETRRAVESSLAAAVEREDSIRRTLEALQFQRDEEETTLQRLREEMEQDSREAAEVLSRLRVDHRQTIDAMAQRHSAELLTIKQKFDQSVSKFNEDSDHIRETSLKSGQDVSEAYQRDKAVLETEYQTKLDNQLHALRAKLADQETTAQQKESQLESELRAVQMDLREERTSRSAASVTAASNLQAQRDASDLEIRKVLETSRDELVRVQNTHFDEITSLKIQTQREMSDSQEIIRTMLIEARKQDARIDSLTLEQQHWLDNSSTIKMQAQKEVVALQERLRVLLFEAERKDEALDSMAREQQRLAESMAAAQREHVSQLSQKEDEVMSMSASSAQLAEQVDSHTSQMAAAEEQRDTLQAELSALESRFTLTVQEKDEQYADLTASLKRSIHELENQVATLSHVDANENTEDLSKKVDELSEELANEKTKTVTLLAQLDAAAQNQHPSESVAESGNESQSSGEASRGAVSSSSSSGGGGGDGDSGSRVAQQAAQQELAKVQAELVASRAEHTTTVEHLETQRDELITTVRVLQVQEQDYEQRFLQLRERTGGPEGSGTGSEEEEEAARNVALLSDLRSVYDQEIAQLKAQFQQKLSDQRDEMQSGYLTLLQKQMANLMGLVNAPDNDNQGNALPKLDEMQSQFASLVDQLPDSLRQQLLSEHLSPSSDDRASLRSVLTESDIHGPHVTGSSAGGRGGSNSHREDFGDGLSSQSLDRDGGGNQMHHMSNQSRHVHHSKQVAADQMKGGSNTATWSNLGPKPASDLSARAKAKHTSAQYLATSSFTNTAHTLKENNNAYHNSYPENDWSSVSSMVKPPISPNDQLIAAILDGDVQGVRTIVRSRGDSLLSEYWRDLALSVLPLHRAISGLHFHGSDQKLIHTIETLVQLGASIDARDHAGNTVLHKAIQVCTSTSVVAVVECIIKKGASPSVRNNVGQCPIHVECSRVRTATTKVLTVLLRAGVDPNVLTKASRSRDRTHAATPGQDSAITLNITPLHLILQRAMSLATAQHADDVSVSDHHQHHHHHHPAHSTATNSTATNTYWEDSIGLVTNAAGGANPSKMRVSGRRVWVQAAYTLVKAGAVWHAAMVVQPGHSQLYLFLHAFPPPPEDSSLYKSLLRGALAAPGMNPLHEDEQGRSALFVLCEQMAKTPREKCPAAGEILAAVLQHVAAGGGGIGGADRSGRTVFDLEAGGGGGEVPDISCLQASRQLLVEAGTRAGGHLYAPEQGQRKGPGPGQAWGWGGQAHGQGHGQEQGEEEPSSHSSAPSHSHSHSRSDSGGLSSFRPPDEWQARQQQRMMPADEYVINGVERMSNRGNSSRF